MNLATLSRSGQTSCRVVVMYDATSMTALRDTERDRLRDKHDKPTRHDATNPKMKNPSLQMQGVFIRG
jgi:hypothetical protein